MSTSEHGLTRAFYDRISGAYDALADAGEHACREKGLELTAIQEGERVLEIGYGTGHTLAALASAVGPSGSVVGIDISQGMHDIAQRRLIEAGFGERVQLSVAAVPPIPCPDAFLDAAFMSFTLELFPLDVIPTLLLEVARTLRPGGRLGVVSMATVLAGERDSMLERTYKWMHRHFPHFVDCQPIEVEHVLDEAGFNIRRQERMEIWTMPVAALVAVPAG